MKRDMRHIELDRELLLEKKAVVDEVRSTDSSKSARKARKYSRPSKCGKGRRCEFKTKSQTCGVN